MTRQSKQSKIEYCLFLLALCAAIFFVGRYVDYTLDADAASELVFSKQLSDEAALISENWFYSTEIRVLSNHLIFAPLFKLFSSWHTVRAVGTAISVILLLLCLLCYCRETDSISAYPLAAMLLVLPLSETAFRYLVKFIYYTPYAALGYLIPALLLCAIRLRQSGRRAVSVTVLSLAALLSLAAGMGGFRLLLNIYAPLCMLPLLFYVIAVASKQGESKSAEIKISLYASLSLSAFALAGLCINTLYLSKRYSYFDYTAISIKSISLKGFETALSGLAELFGYTPGERLLSAALLPCAMAVAFLILSVYAAVYILRRAERFSFPLRCAAGYFVCVTLLLGLLYSFTDMIYQPSYILPCFLLALPLIISFLKNALPEGLGHRLLMGLCALSLLCSAISYNSYRKQDSTSAYRRIADFLKAEGYSEGYASFWNANVLTELSDGYIDVWTWSSCTPPLDEPSNINRWLEKKSHADSPPSGKLFVLVNGKDTAYGARRYWEYEDFFGAENLIYKTYADADGIEIEYAVYGYDSYEKLLDRYES